MNATLGIIIFKKEDFAMQEWLNTMADEAKDCGLDLAEFLSVLENKFDVDPYLHVVEIARAWGLTK